MALFYEILNPPRQVTLNKDFEDAHTYKTTLFCMMDLYIILIFCLRIYLYLKNLKANKKGTKNQIDIICEQRKVHKHKDFVCQQRPSLL